MNRITRGKNNPVLKTTLLCNHQSILPLSRKKKASEEKAYLITMMRSSLQPFPPTLCSPFNMHACE